MKFTRKDKNGKEREVVIVQDENWTGHVCLCIYEDREMDVWVKNWVFIPGHFVKEIQPKRIFYTGKGLDDLRDWECKDYEEWVDKAMKDFDRQLTSQEADQKTLDLIEEGCK